MTIEQVSDMIVENIDDRDEIPKNMDARLNNNFYMTNIINIKDLNDAGSYRVIYEAQKPATKNVTATDRHEAIDNIGQVLPDGRHVVEILQVKELETKDKDIDYLDDVEEGEDEEVDPVEEVDI